MSLTLPADIEPFCDSTDDFHRPGAYALVLDRPDDFREAWDRAFDTRPDWLHAAAAAETLAYVGGASDVLSRLEDHRNGDVRVTIMTAVCDIRRLQTVWWSDWEPYDVTEYNLAVALRDTRPTWFIHFR